ncbi:MAG TPA: reverse transcriptase family protein [Candidatus Acidoferrales bacterium]|nr:reverse transcriptase family protein [Candidatus Acidoferrales bacterium]
MTLFNIDNKQAVARLLAVAPCEIDTVLANRSKYYRSFKQRKADGTYRQLYDPQDPLKLLQYKVKTHILDSVPLPTCVHGGVRNRSLLTNARPHVRKQIVFSVDLKGFYPSIGPNRVLAIFKALGFSPAIAELLTDITVWDRHVPQGVATSTALANLAMTGVDIRIQGLANKHGFSYTRWVDDLTLSGSSRLLDFRRLITRIVDDEGFVVNPQKVFTMHSGMRQLVAGVVVNRKPNVPREKRKSIRQGIIQLRLNRYSGGPSVDQVRGKISWLSQLNPALGLRFANRLVVLEKRGRIPFGE